MISFIVKYSIEIPKIKFCANNNFKNFLFFGLFLSYLPEFAELRGNLKKVNRTKRKQKKLNQSGHSEVTTDICTVR